MNKEEWKVERSFSGQRLFEKDTIMKETRTDFRMRTEV